MIRMLVLILSSYDYVYFILTFTRGRAKDKCGGTCWRSLNSKYNHQLLHKMTWNGSRTIVEGFVSNKFHEFWCSHIFCRIFNFSPNTPISNDELECTIAKSSSRRSKWIYHLLYLEFGNKKISNPRRNQHRKTLKASRRHPDEAWAETLP
jgi:hypothetical protein